MAAVTGFMGNRIRRVRQYIITKRGLPDQIRCADSSVDPFDITPIQQRVGRDIFGRTAAVKLLKVFGRYPRTGTLDPDIKFADGAPLCYPLKADH